MDDALIFHQAMKNNGGRVNASLLPPVIAQSLDYAAYRARGFLSTAAVKLPHLPSIHFDIADAWSFNAFAFRCEGRYFIGVNRGLIASLAVVFDRMLGDPEVIPFIGAAEDESTTLPLIPTISELVRDFIGALEAVPEFARPRCKARGALAHVLSDLAFDFIIAHEFAHIANGHLDLASTRDLSITSELLSDSDVENMLVNQTLEMDADATAVVLSLGSEWHKLGRDDYYRYPGLVCYFWSFAVLSVFRLFGESRITTGDVTREPYPRPRLRGVMAQHATRQLPVPAGREDHPVFVVDEPDGIPKMIKAAQTSVENAFARISGILVSEAGLDEAWGDAGAAQINRLREYWRTTLRDKLGSVAYHPLNDYPNVASG